MKLQASSILMVIFILGCAGGNDNVAIDVETKKKITNKTPEDKQKINYRYDDKGYLHVGLMYWYGPLFAMDSDYPYIMGKVTNISDKDKEGFYDIDVKVLEVIGNNISKEIRELKGISLGRFHNTIKDIALGDQFVTSMTIYENGNAIPHYQGTNYSLGYKIKYDENGKTSKKLNDFLNMLRNSSSKNKHDLRIWADIDPRGVAEILLIEREMKEYEKKD